MAATTFAREGSKVPTDIGRLRIEIIQQEAGAEPEAQLETQVLDAGGAVIKVRLDNLWPRLPDAQKTALETFLANVRTKAAQEMI